MFAQCICLNHVTHIIEYLGNCLDTQAPGIGTIATQYENSAKTKGHIHFIHDCKTHHDSCRHTWLRSQGPLRFYSRRLWRWERTRPVISKLLYFMQNGTEITYLLTKTHRETIPAQRALLQIGGYTRCTGQGQISEGICYDDPAFAQKFTPASYGNRCGRNDFPGRTILGKK